MKKSLKLKPFFGFIALLFVLLMLGSKQECKAQFGLFDTVWTIKNQGTRLLLTSKNDSLSIIYEEGPYLFRLINTFDKSIIWTESWNPYGFINNDSCIIFHGYLTVGSEKFENLIIKNTYSLSTLDSITYSENTLPFKNCMTYYQGISEVDTSIYYSGYCNVLDIKASSYKVNYKTGLTTITSDSLPYFAMTMSEDGQYVAGVYYTGGTASNVPYNEVIEVRKISDYSLVFRESKYYCDYTSNFYPYSWVDDYRLTLSNNGRFLSFTQRLDDSIKIYDCNTKQIILYEKRGEYYKQFLTFSKYDNKAILKIGKKLTKDYSNMNLTIIDLIDNSRKVLDLPDTTMFRIIDSKLIFNDEYLMGTSSYWKKIDDFLFNGDIVLLKLNFDLNSLQEPQKDIIGTLYPNPTNITINLTFELNVPVQLNYSIYTETGQIIKPLLVEHTNPGTISKSFDVSDLPIGTYFLRITGENFSQTYKVIINR